MIGKENKNSYKNSINSVATAQFQVQQSPAQIHNPFKTTKPDKKQCTSDRQRTSQDHLSKSRNSGVANTLSNGSSKIQTSSFEAGHSRKDMTIYSGLNSSMANVCPSGPVTPPPQVVVPKKFPKALKAVRSSGTVTQRSEENEYSTDIFVWGSDKNGQLGQNANKKMFTVPRQCLFQGLGMVKKVSCGDSHTAILTAEGLLYTFGSNQGGKLGLKDPQLNDMKVPTLVEELLSCHDVCCANSFTLAVTSHGQAFSWGTNSYGALGLGSLTATQKPSLVQTLQNCWQVSAKYNHSMFLNQHGQVYVCGKNDLCQLGIQSTDNLQYPVKIQSIQQTIINVEAGRDFSLFLTENQEVLACGANNEGQLGMGDTHDGYVEPTKIPGLQKVRKIEANEGSVAIDQSGTMFVWGLVAKDKSLIIPTKVQSLSERIVDCSIGKFTYSAIDDKQMVWVWGDNKQSQLGLSDYTPRSTPYPLLSLKDKQIDNVHFGLNFAFAISRYPKVVTTQESMISLPQSSPSHLQQTPLFNNQNLMRSATQDINNVITSPQFAARHHQSQMIQDPDHFQTQDPTSYYTPSNYNIQGDISSAYHSQNMYQHPVLPSFPQIQHDKKEQLDGIDSAAGFSQRTSDDLLPPRGRSLGKKSNPGTVSQKSLGTRRTVEEYEAQIMQFENLAAQYEKEMNELRASNQEQSQDLHCMIQTVNEVKEQNSQLQANIDLKDQEYESLIIKQKEELNNIKKTNNDLLSQQIEQIDFLTKKIEEQEDMYAVPNNCFKEEIVQKQKIIQELTSQLSHKTKDMVLLKSEIERHKITIESLNDRMSDMELQNIEMKEKNDTDLLANEKKRIEQNLDMQKNINKCQQMTIEKLENRIQQLENDKNEDAKQEQTFTLERAQLTRKISALENQLRFQTNLNDEKLREIQKLDNEISQVADNCSNREQILQRKLEDTLECLRQERVMNASLKSEIMQRDNHIDQLKTNLKKQTADTKLARLENEALIKQCEYEKNSIGQKIQQVRIEQIKSPDKTRKELRSSFEYNPTTVKRGDDSYLDLSYTHSPSLILNNQRQLSVERQYIRDNNRDNGPQRPVVDRPPHAPSAYNHQLLQQIQNKTMRPLIEGYGGTNQFAQKKERSQSLQEQLQSQKEAKKPVEERQPYTIQEQNERYNQQVNKGYNEIMSHSASKSAQQNKRSKTTEPNAGEPTYIQKLLGLNRTESQSKYAHAIPSWQKLLKNKQQALVSTLEPKRKLSFGANDVSMTDINERQSEKIVRETDSLQNL